MDNVKGRRRVGAARSPRISTLSLVAAVLIAFSICWSPAVAWSRSPFGAPASTADAGAEGVRLWINRASVKPNGTVKVRVDNRGSQPVVFGDPFQLEREEAGTWRRLPGEGPFFAPRHSVRPGMVGEIQVVHVPRWAPRGAYRIKKRVKPAIPEGRWRFIAARFEVI